MASRTPAETKRAAQLLLNAYGQANRHTLVFALAGSLGSGKTTFVQGLARALGICEKIQSPTFVLMKWYDLPRSALRGLHLARKKYFVHIDAYRLETARDANHLGLRKLFHDPEAIIAVEWADRIKKLIPRSAVWIKFEHKSKNMRLIKVTNPHKLTTNLRESRISHSLDS